MKRRIKKMNCESSNWLKYIEDVLSPEEKIQYNNHLKHCEKCRNTLADMGFMYSILAADIPKSLPSQCVASEDLLDYVEGNVSETRRTQIELHLNECSMCKSEMEYAKQAFQPSTNQAAVPHIVPELPEFIKRFLHKSPVKEKISFRERLAEFFQPGFGSDMVPVMAHEKYNSTHRCDECGEMLAISAQYCQHCGLKVEEGSEQKSETSVREDESIEAKLEAQIKSIEQQEETKIHASVKETEQRILGKPTLDEPVTDTPAQTCKKCNKTLFIGWNYCPVCGLPANPL
ncbi:MAG: hypothetical protein A2161_19030 [Candidatus Schekmanbacteria bacterium RBG_13_48_7]|uniref:Uncharacterized protein n=1 Tax=Candidatus Schekmanbacteria bacterium RBG_13_48_7 TaxID=1817878 RepID=A0A1F7RQK4_9BACT|nr:MAG: hypothetical protein A2161_19030 [Candidatus Schekmanbacteria bacterium RBG_13_48_7]